VPGGIPRRGKIPRERVLKCKEETTVNRLVKLRMKGLYGKWRICNENRDDRPDTKERLSIRSTVPGSKGLFGEEKAYK